MPNIKNESDTNHNNKGNWDHLKIIWRITEQHTGKAGNNGTTANIPTGHCTHALESTNIKV
jgi:hypothetical protein